MIASAFGKIMNLNFHIFFEKPVRWVERGMGPRRCNRPDRTPSHQRRTTLARKPAPVGMGDAGHEGHRQLGTIENGNTTRKRNAANKIKHRK